jgi:NADH-quinone oxidoreductase subunit G
MARIKVDGTIYQVAADRNLLETCLALGFDIPYFCNHPALGSVGACRLCAVKKYRDKDDKKGKIIMSCMEPVCDGLIISVSDPEVKKFRAAVIEGLMTNHPHDCPVCDEGGECHLQDMTVMTGHDYRSYTFKKRTYNNQYLGPFIQHEMNRCIQCYRCVRFYKDYAGGKDLNVFGSANHIYFGRQKDGVLENEFSGNLVEVCPTGVFTDKTLKKNYARKWDMTNAPSVCVHCSLGCNIIVSERYGSVRRVTSRYNGSVNGYFICDRGRFGYEFVNTPERIKNIQIRTSRDSDLQVVKEMADAGLSRAFNTGKTIGIGSPRASLESNFALSTLVGKSNFYHGIPRNEHKLAKKAVSILQSGIAHPPSLKDIEKCDAILVLSEDITNSAPMLALAVRQAVRNKSIAVAARQGIPKWNDAAVRGMGQDQKSPLFVASPFTTKLDEIAKETFYFAPEDIARLGHAVASAISPGTLAQSFSDEALVKAAKRIAEALSEAENPLIVTGISAGNEDILNASSNICLSLLSTGKKSSLSISFTECNSAGLALMDGNSLDEAAERIKKDSIESLIILENDLYRRISVEKADAFFDKCQQVIVLDHLMNETAKRADVLLPAATYAESDGTIVNNEGRAQRFYNVLPVSETLKESWRWIEVLARLSGNSTDILPDKFDNVVDALVRSYPVFNGIKEQIPDAGFRFFNEKIARQTRRFSGRTAINAGISVSEPHPPTDPDSPLDFSMEGYRGNPPSGLIPFYWSPGWNSNQSMYKYMDEPDGHLNEGGDPGIRLFNNKNEGTLKYFEDLQEPFAAKSGELRIVPVILIFGSEELSSYGGSVGELIPGPFLLLNEKELKKLKLAENNKTALVIDQIVQNVVIKTDNTLPDGLAGLSSLAKGMQYIELPAWGKVLKTD